MRKEERDGYLRRANAPGGGRRTHSRRSGACKESPRRVPSFRIYVSPEYHSDAFLATPGQLDYRAAFPGPDGSYQTDSVLEVASLTKLITAIAALQLIEKNQISLEQDVSSYIPAFADQPILTGFTEKGSPITRPRRNQITLERLLTHTAGGGYPFTDERLNHYVQNNNNRKDGTVAATFDFPLSYEPGESWKYSNSMDRLGQIVEKLSGQTLDEYFQEHIFRPLGISQASFWNLSHPPMAVRTTPNGPAVPDPTTPSFTTGLSECFGGQGVLMNLEDFMKILHSLLTDDGTLLKSETVAELFRPRLSHSTKDGLLKELEHPSWAVGDLPPTREYNWAIGGLVIDGDSHPYRRRNTVLWSGAPSCFWVRLIQLLSHAD